MNIRVTEYFIAYGNNPGELEADINEYLKKGWELYGNLRAVAWVTNDFAHREYTQAMVKYANTCQHQYQHLAGGDGLEPVTALDCSLCGELRDPDWGLVAAIDKSSTNV